MKKRALVYFPAFSKNIGGSEYLAFTIIKALQGRYDVTLAMSGQSAGIAEAAKIYGVDADWNRVETVDLRPQGALAKLDRHLKFVWKRRLRKLGRNFDVCISCANPVDFGRPGIHFVYMMTFDRYFQAWAQEWNPKGKWWLRHHLLAFRDWFACVLAGVRTPRRIVRNPVEVVLPNSNYVRGMIERYYKCKVHEAFYPPTMFETDLPNSQDRNQIGYIGRMQSEKRIVEMIEIVRQARERSGHDLKFHLAGVLRNFPYDVRIKDLAGRYPWIVLHGPVTGVGKQKFLSSIAIALHGRKSEEFGISITEYLKAGVVPLVPKTGGSPEVVDDPDLAYGTDDEASVLLERLVSDETFYLAKLAHDRERAKLFSSAAYLERQKRLLAEMGVVS